MSEDALATACRRLRLAEEQLGAAAALPADDRDRLGQLLHAAIAQRDLELDDAVTASLGLIPRPLRRVVAKVVRG